MFKSLILYVGTNNRTYCARPFRKEAGCPHLSMDYTKCEFWGKQLTNTQVGSYIKTCRCIECVEFEVAVDKAKKR